MSTRIQRVFAGLAGLAVLTFSTTVCADPPMRVARLGYVNGGVSLSPAGETQWDWAAINRPLTSGDRLWTESGARAEIQIGGATVRMGATTGVSVLNLDDQIAQMQLTQGILNVRVRRLQANQVFEVDTPNLAFSLTQAAEYRIEVSPDGQATTILVRKGQGEAYGEDVAYMIDPRQAYRFTGTGLRDYQVVDAQAADEFDRWGSDRDRRNDRSASARYVSQDVVGYQDLDANGTWRSDANYGNVWIPNHVAAGWAPYSDGHWTWIDPWGWTWVDNAPWGFAVSHYGRWASLGSTWGWVPGPVRMQAYYAPALVVFVGGNNFLLSTSNGNVGGVAWFPLGPREIYRPAYPVSRGYYENVNRSNTVVNNTVIQNNYNNSNVTNAVYVNRQVPGAVVAVPTTMFVQSQALSRSTVRIAPNTTLAGQQAFMPPVAPTAKSVHGNAAPGGAPPAQVFARAAVGHVAPPAIHPGFAAQQQQLNAKPGQPLDEASVRALKPAAPTAEGGVKVIARPQQAPRTLPPAPSALASKPDSRNSTVPPAVPAGRAAAEVPAKPTPGSAPVQAPSTRSAGLQVKEPPAKAPLSVKEPPPAKEPPARVDQGGVRNAPQPMTVPPKLVPNAEMRNSRPSEPVPAAPQRVQRPEQAPVPQPVQRTAPEPANTARSTETRSIVAAPRAPQPAPEPPVQVRRQPQQESQAPVRPPAKPAEVQAQPQVRQSPARPAEPQAPVRQQPQQQTQPQPPPQQPGPSAESRRSPPKPAEARVVDEKKGAGNDPQRDEQKR